MLLRPLCIGLCYVVIWRGCRRCRGTRWGRGEFFQGGFDLCFVTDGHQDELAGVDVGLGGFRDLFRGYGFKSAGKFGPVVEGKVVEEDVLHTPEGGASGFEASWEGVEQGVFCQLELGG